MTEHNLIFNLPRLNPEKFTYENYYSSYWDNFGFGFSEISVPKIRKLIKKLAIGYCDSSRIVLRPKANEWAVMFEVEGEEFWFHIPHWWAVEFPD